MYLDEEKNKQSSLELEEGEIISGDDDEDQETHLEEEEGDGGGGGGGASLRMKLKIRSQQPKSIRSDHQWWREEEENTVCKLCDKGFNSGRALGGHMRVQYQQMAAAEEEEEEEEPRRWRHSSSTSPKKLCSSSELVKKKPSRCCDVMMMNNKNENKDENKSSSSSSSSSSSNKHICWECGKEFPSAKALFGHMRCHPEREWRGIQPPPPTSAKFKNIGRKKMASAVAVAVAVAAAASDSVVVVVPTAPATPDCEDSPPPRLPSWSVTAKRGRKSIGSVGPGKPMSEEIAMCGLLLTLANTNTNSNSNSNYYNSLTEEEYYLGDFYDSPPSNRKCKAQEENPPPPPTLALVPVPEPVKQEKEEKAGTAATTVMMVRKKTKLLRDLHMMMPAPTPTPTGGGGGGGGEGDVVVNHEEPSSTPSHAFPERYKCTTCNKSFPTHQALGGHKSSHNKIKTTTAATATVALAADHPPPPPPHHHEMVNNVSSKQQQQQQLASKIMGGESLHLCQICYKAFPTGQALGGHKRCHWSGPASVDPTPPPPTVVKMITTTTAVDDQINKWPTTVKFDLNELPPMEEDHNEDRVAAVS